MDFLYWAFTDGQTKVQALNYAPLPDTVASDDLAQMGKLQFNGKTLAPSSTVKGGSSS